MNRISTEVGTASDPQKRDSNIDIIKALGIISMVSGHCNVPLPHFIYLFHMAIFFIASGYCFSSNKSQDFKSLLGFIKKKFITLWFPFVLWTSIYSCLHNFFISINVYTNNPELLEYVSGPYIATTPTWTIADILKNIIKACFFLGKTQMGGAFWFIAILMAISIGYCGIDFLIKKFFKISNTLIIQLVISIIFLGLGYLCHLTGRAFFGIDGPDVILSCYILFYGGVLIKQCGIYNKDIAAYKHLIITVISFVILFICSNIGSVSLGINSYKNPIFLLIVSFTGWQFLYELAYFITKVTSLKNLIICIGQNTMAVVILHFLCFKIVSYIGVLIKGEPLFLVAAFPVLYTDGLWWVFYLAVGLSIPVILSIVWKKIKKVLLKYVTANKLNQAENKT